MAEKQRKPPYGVYFAVFALVFYIGVLMPWSDELEQRRAVYRKNRSLVANKAALTRKLKLTQKEWSYRANQLACLGLNLKFGSISREAAFDAVAAAAVAAGLPEPDVKPIQRRKNGFFDIRGCSVTLPPSPEEKITGFIKALSDAPGNPLVRSLALEAASDDDRPLVRAEVEVSWVSGGKKAEKALESIRSAVSAAPSTSACDNYCLFAVERAGGRRRAIENEKKGRQVAPSDGGTLDRPETPPGIVSGDASGGGIAGARAEEDGALRLRLLGLVSVDGADGIVVDDGGKGKILTTGESYSGHRLQRVTVLGAYFSRGRQDAEPSGSGNEGPRGNVLFVPFMRLSLESTKGSNTRPCPASDPPPRRRGTEHQSGKAAIPSTGRRHSLLSGDICIVPSGEKSTSPPLTAPKAGLVHEPPAGSAFGLECLLRNSMAIEEAGHLAMQGFRRVAMLLRVPEASPAQKLGFRTGDLIFAIDGRKLTSSVQVRIAASRVMNGASVVFSLLRQGKRREITARVGTD